MTCACTLQHRVVIQSVSGAADGTGGFTNTWSTYTTVWAEIKSVSTYEAFKAQSLNANISHKITLRYSTTAAAITTKHRVKFGARYFNIQGIKNIDERNQWLELTCMENSEAAVA